MLRSEACLVSTPLTQKGMSNAWKAFQHGSLRAHQARASLGVGFTLVGGASIRQCRTLGRQSQITKAEAERRSPLFFESTAKDAAPAIYTFEQFVKRSVPVHSAQLKE